MPAVGDQPEQRPEQSPHQAALGEEDVQILFDVGAAVADGAKASVDRDEDIKMFAIATTNRKNTDLAVPIMPPTALN